MLFLTLFLRRSRYLYFIRSSSPPSVSSSIVNGGISLRLRIFSSSTSISISPVGVLGFLLLRSFTFPAAWITNSRPSFLAFSQSSLLVSRLKTSCVTPYRSRRSTNVIPPRSLDFCTHPQRITLLPSSFRLSSPQVFVLYILLFLHFSKNKKIILICQIQFFFLILGHI